MTSELLSNSIYVTYVTGTNSKGQDTTNTQMFRKINLEIDDEGIADFIQAISKVLGKTVLEAGKLQKYSIEQN